MAGDNEQMGQPLQDLGYGLRFSPDGKFVSVKVWAVYPKEAIVEVLPQPKVGPKPTNGALATATAANGTAAEIKKFSMVKDEANHCFALKANAGTDIAPGDYYRFRFILPDGRQILRADAYARRFVDSLPGQETPDVNDNKWCVAIDNRESAFEWGESESPEKRIIKPFDEYLIYELHIGSFTQEGTIVAAMDKLEHIRDLGFTVVELMPMAEFSHATEKWGYNPRLLMALHKDYGTPEDMKKFVKRAHELHLSVMIDVVLHHGAVGGNELWDYDGWEHAANGGIYHENAPDTDWGRAFAFWKNEVVSMLYDSCAMWLDEYHCDGLRFDSANDLAPHATQQISWKLHERFPGRLLSAEITPENPMKMSELGLDSLWVHSGYFDIIEQARSMGRGSHGGSEYRDGWNLPRLRTVMTLHYGFNHPTHCIKYVLGSHDQIGCHRNGGRDEGYSMIGSQHRYAADQFGGGRCDPPAVAAARLWYTCNIGSACIPLVFMGSEWMQPGWWDENHRINWDHATDDAGGKFMRFMKDVNQLRHDYPNLRYGNCTILHEDRPNGVFAFQRVTDNPNPEENVRMLIVCNASRTKFQSGNYGLWIGGGDFEEVFSSQAPQYGGWEGWKTNLGRVTSHDGKIWINIPEQCTLVYKQVY